MPTAHIPRIAFFVLTLGVAACGGGPVSPGSGSNFQGVWDGTWQRTSCSETGGAVGVACNTTPTTGGLRVSLSQSGNEVQGTVEFATFVVPATGTVSGGALSLSGQTRQQGATATISNWNTTRSGSAMNGAFTFSIVADNPAFGSQTLSVTLQNVTKTS